MNNKIDEYKMYFNEHSTDWLTGAYEKTDYDYPVGLHRLRILSKIVDKYDLVGKRVLDIGCGGGDISFLLASRGACVDGIDMSEEMLDKANNRKLQQPIEIQENLCFRYEDFTNLSDEILKNRYDIIIAFGLIGYLESDDVFFEIVKKIAKKNTLLVVSCRNELFNITSVSNNTINEIQSENAVNLINEIDGYYNDALAEEKSNEFLDNLSSSIEQIRNTNKVDEDVIINYHGLNMPKSQPRQSTPMQFQTLAQKQGFSLLQYYGVHPHLLLPRLNKKLPPRVFNMLCDALCVFEEDSISLIWSSVFIGEFILSDIV